MATDYSVYGKYAEQTLRGNLFVYKAPAQALLLAATGGGHPTLFNPLGSGKVFIPTRLVLGFVSGTTVIGSVLIAETTSAGANANTGAPIPTFTEVAAVPAYRGAGGVSVMKWAPTVNTFTAAPTVLSATSISLGAADPTNSGFDHTQNFDGTLAFAPGSAMSICYSVTSSVALYILSLFGVEITVPIF